MVNEHMKIWPALSRMVTIDAPASQVWRALTDPELIKQWMSDEGITVITDWKVGHSILTKGINHWVYFENTGTVLKFEPEKILKYSHLSSLSKLPDAPENYTLFEFELTQVENQTVLTVTVDNFPTESIYRHLVFYWNMTPGILKKFIENNNYTT